MLGFARLPPPNCLTANERRLVSLVGRGFKDRDLAARLSIPTDCVAVEIRGVNSKLGLRNLHALAIYAKHSDL